MSDFIESTLQSRMSNNKLSDNRNCAFQFRSQYQPTHWPCHIIYYHITDELGRLITGGFRLKCDQYCTS